MTNRQLLRTPPERLSSAERQRQHALAVASIPVPCPACQLPVDAIAAAGLDIDEYTSGTGTPGYHWLREHHPELLERALAIEANARPNLTSVVGLGRSFSWADFLDDLDDTPLFDCRE